MRKPLEGPPGKPEHGPCMSCNGSGKDKNGKPCSTCGGSGVK